VRSSPRGLGPFVSSWLSCCKAIDSSCSPWLDALDLLVVVGVVARQRYRPVELSVDTHESPLWLRTFCHVRDSVKLPVWYWYYCTTALYDTILYCCTVWY
jgi:hypothetical protein